MVVRWNIWDRAAFVATVLTIGYFVSLDFMPRIDGMLRPVTSLAQLTSYTHSPPPEWRGVWGAKAVKHRECEYVLGSIRWYFGEPGGPRQQVYAKFEDEPQIRSTGELEWEALVVDLDPNIVMTRSYATVRHRCPWTWWDTETMYFHASLEQP